MHSPRALGFACCLALVACGGSRVREPAGAQMASGAPAPRRFDGTTLSVAGGRLRLEVCAARVLRVAFARDEAFFDRPTLATAPRRCERTPWELERSAGQATLRTSKLELRVELESGSVAFHDRAGALILAEKPGGRSLEAATVLGEATHHVRQQWLPAPGEALYGLGNHQLGVLDLAGYDLELAQYNTNAVVPVLVSSRGYGLFWDNTSYTKFGDPGPFQPVPGLRYEPDGDLVESASGTADVSLELTPPATGEYLFRTFSSGDVKLSVGGTELVRHFRQGWLPDADLARVRLEAGVKVPLRIEWRADIGVKTLKVEWKPPPKEPRSISLWSEVGDGIDYWFLHGPELDDVIRGYRRLTGEAPLMPRWAFGLFQSRERYKSAAELSEVVRGFRSRNIPLDVIVQDWRYWVDGQWGSHEFDASRFPDPKALLRELRDEQRVKFMISVWPKFYTNTENYRALKRAGFTYPEASPPHRDFLGQPFAYYDAFSEGGRRMFWEQLRERLFSLGVDAWWLDATEPEVVEGPYRSLLHGKELYASHMHPTALGSGARMLNAYALVSSQAVYEGQRAVAPDQRVFILTRSAFAGQQRYASAVWSGDITSTWTALARQIPGGLGFSITGVPYWTVDSGGFSVPSHFARGQNADEWAELNTRWFEYATFLPILRVHGQAPPREMWQFGGDDSPAYRAMLKFDRLRYRMLPYVYSLAGAVTHAGSTMLRPLVMDFRDDPEVFDLGDQYLFGPALLVSPVTTPGATSRSLYLPRTPSGWYDFWTGAALAGGQRVTAAAPLDSIPVHVRAGSLVPFGPELTYTSEKPADPIVVYVYAGRDGSFELYEDDGATYGYEKGEFSWITLRWDDRARTFTVGDRRGSFPGMLAERTFHVVLVTPDRATGFSFTPPSHATVRYTGRATSVRVR